MCVLWARLLAMYIRGACRSGVQYLLIYSVYQFAEFFEFRSAGLTLFGKNADINVSIGEGGVSCSGGVDDFKFGPLEVSGVTGPRACFELVLNSKRQGGKIDGRIVFCGIEYVSAHHVLLH